MKITNGYFEHAGEPFMPVGFNYWPSRTGVYCWRHFDLGEWKEDFALIRKAGFNTVRMFLLWEDFQPREDKVDADMLERLSAVAGQISIRTGATGAITSATSPCAAPC